MILEPHEMVVSLREIIMHYPKPQHLASSLLTIGDRLTHLARLKLLCEKIHVYVVIGLADVVLETTTSLSTCCPAQSISKFFVLANFIDYIHILFLADL